MRSLDDLLDLLLPAHDSFVTFGSQNGKIVGPRAAGLWSGLAADCIVVIAISKSGQKGCWHCYSHESDETLRENVTEQIKQCFPHDETHLYYFGGRSDSGEIERSMHVVSLLDTELAEYPSAKRHLHQPYTQDIYATRDGEVQAFITSGGPSVFHDQVDINAALPMRGCREK
ncbi:MAG: hypothetical protein J0L97_06660 [Alphaproteobacteria bacterium]|nr:hypothetical protein [Alphaproteobacteria bacterium]